MSSGERKRARRSGKRLEASKAAQQRGSTDKSTGANERPLERSRPTYTGKKGVVIDSEEYREGKQETRQQVNIRRQESID